jgi:hypothetical protein
VLTADPYTSVPPAAQYRAAEAIARLGLTAARRDRDKIATMAKRTGVAAQQMSEKHPRRSPAVTAARQPPST